MTKFDFGNIKIDSDKVKDFFDSRNKSATGSLSSVNLQKDKVLSEARDIHEKNLIVPLLNLTGEENVLEIGCGIGRFVPAIINNVSNYIGLDFSTQLIEIAKKSYSQFDNAHFQVMSATDINQNTLFNKHPFNLIMTMGLMVYLNDDDCSVLVDKIIELSHENLCTLYLRESVSIMDKRLTLKDFYSKDLESNYNAIYRTSDEYMSWFSKFQKRGFELVKSDFLLNNQLSNRTETSQKFWIFKNY